MEAFVTALIGASVGVLAVSAFLPSDKLRRSAKETVVLALAAMFGAGVFGLVTGDAAGGLSVGLAMAFAFVVPPQVVLGFRAGSAHNPGR